jgi:oligopeptide transport system substrate-binding protein
MSTQAELCFSNEAAFPMKLATALCAMLLLSGCGETRSNDPLTISVIGTSLKLVDPDAGPLSPATEVLLGATAQGLVSFDANDQVQTALAERWIVTDDGLSYIFRIREARWPDGAPVTSVDVAKSLKRSMVASSRNPLQPIFSNVTAVIPMTGQVVEIRLRVPERNFLQLLSQPELAILKPNGGTGPFRIHSRRVGVLRLRPAADPDADPQEKVEIKQADDIRLRAERPALAIRRFERGEASYVMGGSFVDLPLARASRPDTARFQVDPAYGLFGLAITNADGPLTSSDVRLALSLAIDRDTMLQFFGVRDWQPAISILPAALDSSGPPAALSDVQASLGERRAHARRLIGGRSVTIRVALPAGPGARLLFASLAADWQRIGVRAVRVGAGQAADLRLIDEVAPVSSAVWYLQRLSCVHGYQCNENAERLLSLAMAETDLTKKSSLISQCDGAFAEGYGYIPLALPMRWSLVGSDLVNWRKSAFSIHNLKDLR